MTSLLFESPWPLFAGLLVAVLVCWIVSRRVATREARRRWRVAGLASLVSFVIVFVVAWAVTTPRERVELRTRGVVDAAGFKDERSLETLVSFLRDDVEWRIAGERQATLQGLIFRLESLIADHPNGVEHQIRRLHTDLSGPDEARSIVELTTTLHEGEMAELPFPTTWDLIWARDADGVWRLHRIDWLLLGPAAPRAW